MALQHLRSSTADKRPTPGVMSDGQLAMNTNLVSPGLFLKDSNGDLVKVGPVHVGTTAPNVTPGAGGQAGNSKGEQWLDTSGSDYTLKTWDGSAWREIVVTSAMIKDGTIVNADINASAAIAHTKLANITAGSVLLGNASNVPTATALSGDVTVSDAGVTAIGSGVIVDADINASAAIAGTKISPNFGSQDIQIGDKIIHDGDTNTAIRFPAADTIAFETDGSERARIDSSGRLLVGPAASSIPTNGANAGLQLHNVANANGAQLSIVKFNTAAGGGTLVLGKSKSATVAAGAVVANNDSLGNIVFVGDDGTDLGSSGAQISASVDGTPGANDMPGRLVFSTTADGSASPTERMRIDNAGKVFFGKTSTDNNVVGMLYEQTGNLIVTRSGNVPLILNRTTNDGTVADFRTSNTTRGTISISGSTTSYNTTSDYRLKENVVLLTGAIDRLQQIPVHRFNFIADPDTVVDGFIAHEAAAIVPECVTGEKDEVDENGDPIYQGIDQSKIVPLLTAALQEAIAKINALEARITALEA
jgi:hypothetical protein